MATKDNWINRFIGFFKNPKPLNVKVYQKFPQIDPNKPNQKIIAYFNDRIHRRQTLMIFYAIPNLVITIVAILAFGYQLGWDKLKEFPFFLLWIYLLYFGVFAFWLRWDEVREEEKDKQKIDDTLNSLTKSQDNLNNNIADLIKRIDERWPK